LAEAGKLLVVVGVVMVVVVAVVIVGVLVHGGSSQWSSMVALVMPLAADASRSEQLCKFCCSKPSIA
jgi:hypothetical protein